jgi:Ca2+-binding RTX toxin-like protein
LNNPNLSLQNAIITQLIKDGLYANGLPDNGQKVWVESDVYKGTQQPPLFDSSPHGNPNVPDFVQVLEVEGQNVTVKVDHDDALKVIVDDGSNAGINFLHVTGDHRPELIVLGNSKTNVDLDDHGNDTVLGGGGDDTIVANDGDDSLVAGSGNDSLTGGSGRDTLIGGSGQDTLTAGTGHHSLLKAGSGNTHIIDEKSDGTDTLVAGSGNDTIRGLQGDDFTTNATMPATGNDVYDIYGDHGNSTIDLGSGHNTVNFHTTGGHDTINYGGGAHGNTDTINFANESVNDFKVSTKGLPSGEYLIKFTDGQSVLLDGHAQSKTDFAFEIHFDDGNTMSLKGGS